MREHVRHLGKGVAIYGAGDAAVQIVNFALLAVYVKGDFLTRVDYGALALILALEAFTKVLFRWGLDGAFMRFYHEREGDGQRQLATTIGWFLTLVNGSLLVLLLAGSGPLAGWLFDEPGYLLPLRLMFVNTFLISFTFLPFHLMRLRDEAVSYSALTFTRSVGTLVLRVVLVIGAGLGLTGIYLADLAMTLVLLPLLWRWARLLMGGRFDAGDLRRSLRFGLPRVPHGLAQQALDGGNKMLLGIYVPQVQVGVYQNATALATGVKFFMSAFETAWAPFYYATARREDARDVFRRLTTYSAAVLVLLVAGTVAVARDLVLVMLTPEYLDAIPVIPIVALGLAFQGVYLLTSIGLNLTSRTEYYPVATFAAAAVGLGSGVLLMPAYGAFGAAAAFVLAFATQATVAFWFSQRFYRITYERARLLRIVLAGVVAAFAPIWLVPDLSPLTGLLVRGAAVVVVYAAMLGVTGFLRRTEWQVLAELASRWRLGARA